MANLRRPLLWNGYSEDAPFAFSCTPVPLDDATIVALFGTCTETTRQVIAERQAGSQRQRQQALLQQRPGFVAVLRDASPSSPDKLRASSGMVVRGTPCAPESGGEGLAHRGLLRLAASIRSRATPSYPVACVRPCPLNARCSPLAPRSNEHRKVRAAARRRGRGNLDPGRLPDPAQVLVMTGLVIGRQGGSLGRHQGCVGPLGTF
jgi:hypothetical protein